jgi:hypothetical protein
MRDALGILAAVAIMACMMVISMQLQEIIGLMK